MGAPLLTAHDCTNHVHLIIGSNPLASARCAKSIEVGAKPKVVAPPDADIHYVLAKRIEEEEVEWIQQSFSEELLRTLGRDEIDCFVDAVFVTSGGKTTTGNSSMAPVWHQYADVDTKLLTYQTYVAAFGSRSMWSMRQTSAPSHFFPLTPTALCR